MSGVEGRMGVVLDEQLGHLGVPAAGYLADEPQSEVDTGRNTSRCHDLSVVHDPLPTLRLGAHRGESGLHVPVGGRGSSVKDACGGEDHRTGTHRRCPPGLLVHPPQPVGQLVVGHHCRGPLGGARHQHDVRLRGLRVGVRDAEEQHPAVGDDRARLCADEAHLGVGQQPQHLVRPDGVQRGQARVERNGDLHDWFLSLRRRPATDHIGASIPQLRFR
jgi:hypothetical protein